MTLALLQNPGGDRAMGPGTHAGADRGLDAVLVAVELAPEVRRHRDATEHVLNVLGHLNATPAPENAAKALQASRPPRAITARYGSLRAADTAKEIDHADAHGGAPATSPARQHSETSNESHRFPNRPPAGTRGDPVETGPA